MIKDAIGVKHAQTSSGNILLAQSTMDADKIFVVTPENSRWFMFFLMCANRVGLYYVRDTVVIVGMFR